MTTSEVGLKIPDIVRLQDCLYLPGNEAVTHLARLGLGPDPVSFDDYFQARNNSYAIGATRVKPEHGHGHNDILRGVDQLRLNKKAIVLLRQLAGYIPPGYLAIIDRVDNVAFSGPGGVGTKLNTVADNMQTEGFRFSADGSTCCEDEPVSSAKFEGRIVPVSYIEEVIAESVPKTISPFTMRSSVEVVTIENRQFRYIAPEKVAETLARFGYSPARMRVGALYEEIVDDSDRLPTAVGVYRVPKELCLDFGTLPIEEFAEIMAQTGIVGDIFKNGVQEDAMPQGEKPLFTGIEALRTDADKFVLPDTELVTSVSPINTGRRSFNGAAQSLVGTELRASAIVKGFPASPALFDKVITKRIEKMRGNGFKYRLTA